MRYFVQTFIFFIYVYLRENTQCVVHASVHWTTCRSIVGTSDTLHCYI